ncbi:MAG: Y-family DNA polymerase [Gammaproteobacteria bacterium]|nr:Y-family DNA polymerase [Gammaproteobacteria bacterium]MBU1654747.1 Y-family DNA polymerase [Gammaproteobacteria bacterium]MBU1961622.1 Y-family DNA polymerase [Gammaproteobacteria bacterium]
MTAPLFALADCNNFYASCERLFNPALAGRPLIVLSNNDGCVVARSNEAKALGIGMGIPFFQARKLVERHRVAVFSSNYSLYGDISRRVMAVLAGLCPDMEIYSIDEAFLRLDRLPHEPLALAREMRDRVRHWTGIPISIGLAPTKTLAKLANLIAKKSGEGVFQIERPERLHGLLARLPVKEVWGIGRRSAERLQALGIETVEQLRRADPRQIRRHLSVIGERILCELNGTPCLDLEETQSNRQILCSKSFGQRVTTLAPILEAVSNYAARAGERLRRQRLCCGHIHVFLQTGHHDARVYSNALSQGFPTPTSDSRQLIRVAKGLAQRLFLEGYRYQKVGVILMDLAESRRIQDDLFTPRNDNPRLMQALDAINARLGADEVFFAAQGVQRPWRMQSGYRSPRYTTCWNELARVS